TVHDRLKQGGYGEPVDSIFQSIRDFLKAYPSEIVIVRVSHTKADVAEKVYALQAKIADKYYYTDHHAGILANEKLEKLRGKVIVAYDEEAIENPNPSRGQIRFGKAKNIRRDGIVTCGEYPNSADMSFIHYDVVSRVKAHHAFQCCDLSQSQAN